MKYNVCMNNMSPMPFTRRATPSEALYNVANDLSYPFILQYVLEMGYEVDVVSLRAAVAKVNAFYPEINATFKQGPLYIHWQQAGQEEQYQAFIEVIEAEWDGESICSAPFYKDAKKLNTEASLSHVIYVKGQRHFLVFQAFHGAVDAMGLYYWVKNIFHAWRNEPLRQSQKPITDFNFLSEQNLERYNQPLSLDCIAPIGNLKISHTL